MKIDVSELRKVEGRSEDFAGTEQSFSLDLQVSQVFLHDLEIIGRALNTGRNILVQGNVEAKVELDCSLCLKPFIFVINFPFEETYHRKKGNILKEEENLVRTYQGDEIDLREMITEGLILSLPMKPLCKPECKGLCPLCGQDRNLVACNCKFHTLNSRLATLKDLLNEVEKE